MQSIGLLIGIVAIAATLRPAITSVGPLIGNIQAELHLSSGLVALSTALPLLSFGLASPFVPRLNARLGDERALALGVATIVVGIGIRLIPSAAALFVGTFVCGIGIAIGNVTLPGFVKARYPERVGTLTGIYSTSMSLFAATASGLSVPLAKQVGLGWRGALGFWALPAFVALLLWWPHVRAARREHAGRGASVGEDGEAKSPVNGRQTPAIGGHDAQAAAAVWRSPLAWQVTLFMGLQSFIFYAMVTWMPELLQAKGMTGSAAGWMLSLAQYISLPPTLLVPMLADRLPDQRGIAAAACVLYAAGLTALFSDATPVLVFAVICIGLSLGTTIGLSLTFLGLRAKNPRDAANLSGMAQSIGYLLAAGGPVLFGFVHDATGSWSAPLVMLIAVCAVLLVLSLGAGRNTTMHTP